MPSIILPIYYTVLRYRISLFFPISCDDGLTVIAGTHAGLIDQFTLLWYSPRIFSRSRSYGNLVSLATRIFPCHSAIQRAGITHIMIACHIGCLAPYPRNMYCALLIHAGLPICIPLILAINQISMKLYP